MGCEVHFTSARVPRLRVHVLTSLLLASRARAEKLCSLVLNDRLFAGLVEELARLLARSLSSERKDGGAANALVAQIVRCNFYLSSRWGLRRPQHPQA